MRLPAVIVLCAATAALADEGPPRHVVDLAHVLAAARKHARVEVARAAASVAHAKIDQVKLAWIPQLTLTAVGGPSPHIRCMPSPEQCITTDNADVTLGLSGVFWRLDLQAVMPLYTFGKISAGTRAAEAGARAADAQADLAEADALVDASKAYYAVKLARELIVMLEEGQGYIDDELKKMDEALKKGTGDITVSDRHRLRSVRAEIRARMSEARKLEGTGLAGVRLVMNDPDADVDDEPLTAVKAELPSRADARAQAVSRRAEPKAAQAAARAARGLVDVEKARWLPDLVAVGSATLARATDADDPQNAFANDQLNVTSFSAGIALRWTLDPGVRPAHIQEAHAMERQAVAAGNFAEQGVAADAERAWAEAKDAQDRLAASREGEKEARAWLVSDLQASEAGLLEPKDLADALLAWFQMRARLIQATFDWDVGLVGLARATGAPL